jgi:hypothetical protein
MSLEQITGTYVIARLAGHDRINERELALGGHSQAVAKAVVSGSELDQRHHHSRIEANGGCQLRTRSRLNRYEAVLYSPYTAIFVHCFF